MHLLYLRSVNNGIYLVSWDMPEEQATFAYTLHCLCIPLSHFCVLIWPISPCCSPLLNKSQLCPLVMLVLMWMQFCCWAGPCRTHCKKCWVFDLWQKPEYFIWKDKNLFEKGRLKNLINMMSENHSCGCLTVIVHSSSCVSCNLKIAFLILALGFCTSVKLMV